MAYTGFSPLVTRLLSNLPSLPVAVSDRSRLEDSLMSGGTPMRKVTIGCSPSNLFACTSWIPSKQLTRCGVSSPEIGDRLTIFRPEILQGGRGLQASEAPEYLDHRRRGTQIVRVLHGVSVDGEWESAAICGKAPGSQSLGAGGSNPHPTHPPLMGLQLTGVARGLSYLHRNEIVHGDLKGVRGVCPQVFLTDAISSLGKCSRRYGTQSPPH